MSLCESIDTLSMAYLDDELAGEERRELELHLSECPGCRGHLADERAEHELVRNAFTAPRAPDLLHRKITNLLDTEDQRETRAERRRFGQWLLPGSAILAAAAAIAVFVGIRPPTERMGAVAEEAVRVGRSRSLPLEVQGASTGAWMREHFAPTIQPPQFQQPGIELLGGRLTAINGHDAALLAYQVTTSPL